MERALAQRPDLLQRVADVQAAKATVKEARAAYYPSLNFTASPTAQSLYGLQQQFPWGQTAGLAGGMAFRLNWTVVYEGDEEKSSRNRKPTPLRPKRQCTVRAVRMPEQV